MNATEARPDRAAKPSQRASSVAFADVVLERRRRTATVTGMLSLALVLGVLIAAIARLNGGGFSYVVDDAYIHLSMARNLAETGTYGLVPGVYESATSSPGWVAILAGLIRVAPGEAIWLPLALDAVAAAGVLVLVLRAQRWLFTLPSAALRGLAYVLLPLSLFLPALVLLGMEHTLHALLVVALLLMLQRAIDHRLSRRELLGVAALSLVAGAVRYETLFLAGGAAVALLLVPQPASLRAALARLRRPEVWAFLAPPVLVTAMLGAINLAHGQYLLPNSVLAKSGLGSGQGLSGWLPSLAGVVDTLSQDLGACALLAIGVVYLVVRKLRGAQSGLWMAWCVMVLLHVMYARWGWYDRYQAYIVVSGMLLLLRTLPELRIRRPMHAGAVLLAILVAVPFTKLQKDFQAPDYAHQIAREQDNLGRFLGAAYDGQTVMVNDIGQVSWQHRGGLDDLWALGSYDILRAYREGVMGKPFVDRIAARDNVQVAAVYSVLHIYIPDEWVQVARWSTAGSGRPEDSDVVFYARDAAAAAVLRAKLAGFASSLPPDVQVLGPA